MKRLRFASSLTAFAIAVVPQLRGADPAKPAPSQAEALSREVREVMRKTGDAICRIEADDEHGHLRGTGFFIDADGTLLTSYSVGGASQDIVVTVGEQRYPAARLVAEGRSGIALLKIAAGRPMPFLKFGKSSKLEVGDLVVTAGYPLDLPLSPSFGPVAGMDLGFDGRFFATRHIRANLAVQRGQGGSPVLNLRGEAVGVLISNVEGNSGIFALPIEAAEKVLHDFRTYGRVRQGWVGVDACTTGACEHGSSARILTLREDGPAYAGGIRPGDILLQVGSQKITNPEDVHNAAFFVTATESLPVRVSRGGKEIKLTVTPLDPPDGTMPTIERQEPLDNIDRILGSSRDGTGLNLGR
ncbi:MAG: S1C family serine protease [Chthoniobacteraceae bacterium]